VKTNWLRHSVEPEGWTVVALLRRGLGGEVLRRKRANNKKGRISKRDIWEVVKGVVKSASPEKKTISPPTNFKEGKVSTGRSKKFDKRGVRRVEHFRRVIHVPKKVVAAGGSEKFFNNVKEKTVYIWKMNRKGVDFFSVVERGMEMESTVRGSVRDQQIG